MGAPAAGVELDINDNVAVLRPWGDLDVVGAAAIRPKLEELTNGHTRQLLLDLQKVSFLDGSGLQELLRVFQHVRSLGGRVSIINGRPEVERLLTVTGCNRMLGRFPL